MMITEVEGGFVVAESPVSVVRDIPFSRKYSVTSKIFGTEHIVKAYTSNLEVEEGHVILNITRNEGSGRRVARPYHFVSADGVLLAWKRNKHNLTDSLALNHELFALGSWDVSVILYDFEGAQMLFVASRREWMEEGHSANLGEELSGPDGSVV